MLEILGFKSELGKKEEKLILRMLADGYKKKDILKLMNIDYDEAEQYIDFRKEIEKEVAAEIAKSKAKEKPRVIKPRTGRTTAK
jgi:hypothetical protein